MKNSWFNLLCGILSGIGTTITLLFILNVDIALSFAFGSIECLLFAIFLQLADIKNDR
jgi:hypothetical protein